VKVLTAARARRRWLPLISAAHAVSGTASASAGDRAGISRTAVAIAPVSAIAALTIRAWWSPFAHARKLTSQRIDMGVDYDGEGEIDAIGNARITFAGTGIGGGWTCSTPANGGIVYQLTDGPDHGDYVYVTEDVTPTVKTGTDVTAGQPIANFAPAGASGCIEIGWASGPHPSPIALLDGGFHDGTGCAAWRTAAGNNMSDLIHALGVPSGLCRDRPIYGHYP
jgi:murein DD-endopeptidase MepM/ murein hydrolase activator NlpD